MTRIITHGSVDQSIEVRILDSTDGTDENAVVYNSPGIDLWYRRQGGLKVSITEVTLSALNDAHADGGFLVISNGVYRLDLPDAAFASGATHVTVGGFVTGMQIRDETIQLVAVNLMDAVRGGMTALPNANAEAAGGLFTRGTGAGQVNQAANGQINVNGVTLAGQAITAAAGVTFPSSIASPTNITAGTLTNLTNAPTVGDFTAVMKASIVTAVSSALGLSVSASSVKEREIVIFDGDVQGDMASTFIRNGASCDRAGNAVRINERRFDSVERLICGHCDWRDTNYDMSSGGVAYILGVGADLTAKRKLAAITRSSSGEIKVLEVDDTLFLITELTNTLATALPGAGGGVTYAPLSTAIQDGTIFLLCSRATSGSYDGLTIFTSQDFGTTWSRISASAFDGGASYFPIPTSYGSSANANVRGGQWSMRITPHGGLDDNALPNSRTRAWITVEDYLRGGATAKGGDCWTVEITRDSEEDQWIPKTGRRLWSTYSTGYTANVHFHSVGMTGGGVFLLNIGDSTGKNSFQALTVDLDLYETATITRTEVFGELAASGTLGRSCPQLFGAIPGPNGSIIYGADLWPSPIMTVANMNSATDSLRISSPFLMQSDAFPGDISPGPELFQIKHWPGKGYTAGGVSVLNETSRGMRFFSPDGKRWAPTNNTIFHDEHHFIVGDAMLCTRNPDAGTIGSPTPDQAVNYRLVMCPLPTVRGSYPLCLAPGADNILHATSTTQPHSSSVPTSPATAVAAKYEMGRVRLVSNSALIANTPVVPAPYPDPLYIYFNNAATSSDFNGIFYARESGNTSVIGANFIQMTFAVANAAINAVGLIKTTIGANTLAVNRTPTTGLFTDRSYNADNPWTTLVNAGDPSGDPAGASRMEMAVYMGPSAATMNKDCPMLFAWGGVYITPNGITPWPAARNTTGNQHEKEVSTVTLQKSTGWTWTVTPIRSDEQASYAGTIPSNTIYTLKKDANNYITIAVDGSAYAIVITGVVGGITADTETIDFDNWRRGTALVIKVTGDATECRVSILSPYEGIKTATLSAVIDWPAQLIYGNVDHTIVYNMMHAGAEFRPHAMTFDEMQREHTTLNCLATNERITADAVALQVDKQLALAFASMPANVWLQTLTGISKADSAGLKVTELLIDTDQLQTDFTEDTGRLSNRLEATLTSANSANINALSAAASANDAVSGIASVKGDTVALSSTIAALNNLSVAQVAAALSTYDAPTKAELDSAVALLATASALSSMASVVAAINTKANRVDGLIENTAGEDRFTPEAVSAIDIPAAEWPLDENETTNLKKFVSVNSNKTIDSITTPKDLTIKVNA